MTRKQGGWISRRGQVDAEAAIDRVVVRQPQAGEQIQQIADTRIEDSPYQARQPFTDASVEDLAQGMRASSFQGVLIVRPHGDTTKQRDGFLQLVYGHRRRVAWRRVCAEQGIACVLPVVVRPVTDEQLLLVGAQENLQRQDLDPVEEAQLVVWHERMFPDKNQSEIGAMLSRSSDWVSTRSRIHRLPGELKERLRQRPRGISQMLELGKVYLHQPELATSLAERVVREELTLDQLRSCIRGYMRPERRGTATSVQEITRSERSSHSRDGDAENDDRVAATYALVARLAAPLLAPGTGKDHAAMAEAATRSALTPDSSRQGDFINLKLLQQVVAQLKVLGAHGAQLPDSPETQELIAEAEHAVGRLRRLFGTSAQTVTGKEDSPV